MNDGLEKHRAIDGRTNSDNESDSLASIEGSVTQWLGHACQGRSVAAEQLWRRYMQRLVRLASRKLGNRPRRVADEEDVALAAFHAFLEGAKSGRFPELNDRNDLWQILVMLTERRAFSQLRQELAEKRGKGAVRGESIFAGSPEDSEAFGLNAVAASEPTPEMAATLGEQLHTLLDALADPIQRRVAFAKLEGKQNAEIAEELSLSLRSVERKLHLIRCRWQEAATRE